MQTYHATAERRLLSCLMDAFIDRASFLMQIPERLFTGNNVFIYRAIEALHRAERPVDLVTLHQYLVENNQAFVTLDLGFFADGITITSDWKTYAADLNQAWKAREEQQIMDDLAADRDIPRAFARYQAMQAVETNASETTAHELAKEYLLNMNEVREGRRKDSVYPTFISPLDRMLTGFKPSEFVLLGGRPAMGKAQPVDAPVMTLTGWKAIGDLRIGDSLASVDGGKISKTIVLIQGTNTANVNVRTTIIVVNPALPASCFIFLILPQLCD